MNLPYATTNADAYKAALDATGRTGFYSQAEMDGLTIARIDDELIDLKAQMAALRSERRKLVKGLGR